MILDRYLQREVATPFIAITFALTTLYVTFSLTRYLTDATEGLLAANAVFTLTMLRAVIALEMLLPVALYIGLMVALGRFYSDWEVTAMKASGISEQRIILPILAIAGLEVFGVILAGYSSASKWSLYGAMREAAQVVSYEVPLGLCVVVPVLVAGDSYRVPLRRLELSYQLRGLGALFGQRS